MAARVNCMARPDEAFGPQAPGVGTSSARGPTSSTRTPIHYGAATATTPGHSGSRSHSRTTSRTGSRALSRGKAIQSSEGSEESDRQGDSEDEDPSFQVLRMSQMFDAPPATQTQGESSQDLETLLETREMLPLRDADKGVFVTTPTSVAGTCSQQPLEGNGAATTLSALSNSSAAVDKAASS